MVARGMRKPMNENKLARAVVAQLDMNFALINFIFKLVDASPSSIGTEDVKNSLSELLEKNSAVLNATKPLVALSLQED
jgi:hypothetical protein